MREKIQQLRGRNKEIREELAGADERINRVILAHFATHEKELEREFALFQTLRSRLLWLMAREEKGLILRHIQKEAPRPGEKEALEEATEEIFVLFDELKAAADGYTSPADGCPTYEEMTRNLQNLDRLFAERAPLAEEIRQNITGEMQ